MAEMVRRSPPRPHNGCLHDLHHRHLMARDPASQRWRDMDDLFAEIAELQCRLGLEERRAADDREMAWAAEEANRHLQAENDRLHGRLAKVRRALQMLGEATADA